MRQDLSPLVLSSAPPQGGRSFLRVPFGLKEGRMWSPKQVPPGKTCGCVCPACQAPLVAKAVDSTHRRPHFAHLGESNCRAGYETALHRKAKEIVADRLRIRLPAWDGATEMRNPPCLRDANGGPLYGRRVEYPSQITRLLSAQVEQSCGDYTPDVVGLDDKGPLLIEIRVTHAVDELKRRRIQSEGQRMVEIDLSKLRLEQVLDDELLEHWVLNETSNRSWVSCPAATDDWRESYRMLKADLLKRNEEIAQAQQQREEALAEYRSEQARAAEELEAKISARERFRLQKRSRFTRELDALPELVSVARIELLLALYEERDRETSEALIASIESEQAKGVVRTYRGHAWIYTVDPALWQAASYLHFVQGKNPGDQFNQRDIARWVLQEFGKEEELYELFKAQYRARSESRKAGFRAHRIAAWEFTALENAQIPNFYAPVNEFVQRLIRLGIVEPVDGVLGQMRVRQYAVFSQDK